MFKKLKTAVKSAQPQVVDIYPVKKAISYLNDEIKEIEEMKKALLNE